MSERKETGLCAAGALAVGRNELHRALEFCFRNCRVLRQDLLIRSVFDAVAGQLLPIARPIAAEPAIAVIDELGPRFDGWPFSGFDGGAFPEYLLHDVNEVSRLLAKLGPLSDRPARRSEASR
jgi:hypothetical protein